MTSITTSRHRPDRLRWIISSLLLAPCLPTVAQGLQPATGSGGTPLISQNQGVPVIDIVAPNGNGLSHNQFMDYNVAEQGAVLNNALEGGQSVLAGVLAANPQFQGHAASVILNEVISQNPSSINGAQEIFGRAADYVLANPNGISVNGASFFNTTRAGFLVGTPEIEDGQLQRLNTLNAPGSLQIHERGLENREGSLELLAPQIDSRGQLIAQGDLNLTIGRNRVNHADGQVIETVSAAAAERRIDASLFGAMQANRIKIVSTATGAGVRIGAPRIEAKQGVQISSAGALHVTSPGEKDPTVERSMLSGGKGDLNLKASDDITLSAVDAQGRDINVKAGKNLVLDALTREKLGRKKDQLNKEFWLVTYETYSRTQETSEKTQVGTQLIASRDIALQAGEDTRLLAANAKAEGKLTINTGDDLTIKAGVDRKVENQTIGHRKLLWRGDSDNTRVSESANASQLNARTLELQSGGKTQVDGSSLHSESNLYIKAATVEIASIGLEQSNGKNDYDGDLVGGSFFGNRSQDSKESLERQGSEVTSNGDLSIVSDEVRISGSRVLAEGQAQVISEQGTLLIENAQSDLKINKVTDSSKLFGLLSERSEKQSNTSAIVSSDIVSQSNLSLDSADELKILGSKITAAEQLELQAKSDITIGGASGLQSSSTTQSSRYFTAQAKQTKDANDGKADSRQFVASVGYEVDEKRSSEQLTTLTGSTLNGASVKIEAGNTVEIDSADISSSAGDMAIAGKTVRLLSGQDTKRSESTSSQSGGGLTVTGGIDRIGSAFEGYKQNQRTVEEQASVVSTRIQANGQFSINADAGKGHIETQGTKLRATGPIDIVAGSMTNREATATSSRLDEQTHWKGSLGSSIEYKDLARPIARLINGEEETKFQQAAIEDAFLPPSLGADLEINHLNRTAKDSSSQAVVSEFSAGTLTAQIAGHLSDSGTRYEATEGTLQINAGSHDLNAAQNTNDSDLQRLEVDGSLRVFTNTGKDINARAAAAGSSIDRNNASTTALPGSLYGQTGIQIQLGSDGQYEGTRFNGGGGPLSIQSGGTLTLAQANDRQVRRETLIDGNGWAKGGNSPASGKSGGASVLLNRQVSTGEATQARVVELDSQGPVVLAGNKGIRLEGTRIGTVEDPVKSITLKTPGKVEVLAAVDTASTKGDKLGGALQVSASASKTAEASSKGGGLGGHFQAGRTVERSRSLTGAHFNSQEELAIQAGSRQDIAIDLEGLKVKAREIALQASQGGIRIQDATSTVFRDNLELTAGAGFNKTTASDTSKNASGLYGRLKVAIDKLDSTTHANSQLRADRVTLDSRLDSRLSGINIDAERIDGRIGGDLLVESRQDQVNGLKVDVDAKLSKENNPQGLLNGISAFAGPAAGKVKDKVGKDIQKLDTGRTATLTAEIEKVDNSTVAKASSLNGREGIDLTVAGTTRLVGATLKSSEGKVEPVAGKVELGTLEGLDSRTQVGLNGSNAPVELITGFINAYKQPTSETDKADRTADLGVLRTGGHNTRQTLPSSIEQSMN
ncbi:Hemolysin precursor [compost metagenome]